MARVVAVVLAALQLFAASAAAQSPSTGAELPPTFESVFRRAAEHMILWRRDFHAHPELGNEEVRTSRLIAAHLRRLNFDEVRTGVARTGVVGIIHGARPGPVIAFRADMDGLPVTEAVDLPFASRAQTNYNGERVGLMHACGHDTHMAIQMALAEILASTRSEWSGTAIFVFQPDEEGAAGVELTGARMMVEEEVFGAVRPEAIFALHAMPLEGGVIFVSNGAMMASEDSARIVVRGRQTHGAMPDRGLDPIVVAAQIVNSLQTIPSRQFGAVAAPVVVTIGAVNGGVRSNIIPDEVVMLGTLRSLDPAVREELKRRVERIVEQTAFAAGLTAEVEFSPYAPALVNDAETSRRATSAIEAALGPHRVRPATPLMTAEDFSYFAEGTPSFYFFYGVNAPGVTEAEPNHSPRFFVHEPTMETGLRAMLAIAMDRLRVAS